MSRGVSTRMMVNSLLMLLTDEDAMDGVNVATVAVDYETGKITITVAGDELSR